MEKSLTKPLRELVLVAEKISSRDDLLIRAKKISNDEFGKLTSMFNKMLDSIRETNQRLVASNLEMESRVKERTNDIKSANDKLKRELSKTNNSYFYKISWANRRNLPAWDKYRLILPMNYVIQWLP